MIGRHIVGLGIGVLVAAGGVAGAQQHGAGHGEPHGAQGQAETKSLQGDAQGLFANAHMKAFFAASVEALAQGPDQVDMAAYEARSREIFAALAESMGADPAMMLDHLKLIPGQVVEIARDDPSILESYDNFVLAMHGPA